MCISVEAGGLSESRDQPHMAEMIEMNSAGSLVWGSLMLA